MGKMTEFENRLKVLTEEFEAYKKAKQAPEIGETREIAGMKWIILDKLPEGYLAYAEEPIKTAKFGENNDWRESPIRDSLKKFSETICAEIGVELPEFERGLISLDGQTEYGSCMDKVSVITVDEYRKYRKYIPNGDAHTWTCTPWSTKCNNDEIWVAVVFPSGDFVRGDCGSHDGVRPICIFPSEIFESEDE